MAAFSNFLGWILIWFLLVSSVVFGVNSELGYLSPGEYEMHRDVTVSQR